MIIRIFGITTPTGNFLYKKHLKNKFHKIYCYSRSDKFIYLDLDIKKYEINKFINKEKEPEIWISLVPIWKFSKFLNNLHKDDIRFIRRIIVCSSSSAITKKFSWHQFDKKLTKNLINSEKEISFFSQKNNINLVIIRPTMIFGETEIYKDKNISKLTSICRNLPFIIFPKNSGKRQPISINQLSKVINKLIFDSLNRESNSEILNIGGDQILSYYELLKDIINANNFKCRIILIPKRFFLFLIFPILFINSKFFSELLRVFSDLSGFTKSSSYLSLNEEKFSKFLTK